VADEDLKTGLYEALLTRRLAQLLSALPPEACKAELEELLNAESADRVSRHVAQWLARAIDAEPEDGRAKKALHLAAELLRHLETLTGSSDWLREEIPVEPGQVLHALLQRRPDGTAAPMDRPLTPLLDTTVLMNSPGEPSVGHEIRTEVSSANSIDVVMAFIRWSGVRPLLETFRRHCARGKRLRILTTTYTNTTEMRALDQLAAIGAEVKVSYDTSSTRLHAKAWIFHRATGCSTAYIGSSNITHSAQVSGLEWNVRLFQCMES
jgi:HKD family nuclease